MNSPGYKEEWPIFTYYEESIGKKIEIKNSEILRDIRAAVTVIGKDVLGFGVGRSLDQIYMWSQDQEKEE